MMKKFALFTVAALTLASASAIAATAEEKATALSATADDVTASKCTGAVGYNDQFPTIRVNEVFSVPQAGTTFDGEGGGYVRTVEVKNPCYRGN